MDSSSICFSCVFCLASEGEILSDLIFNNSFFFHKGFLCFITKSWGRLCGWWFSTKTHYWSLQSLASLLAARYAPVVLCLWLCWLRPKPLPGDFEPGPTPLRLASHPANTWVIKKSRSTLLSPRNDPVRTLLVRLESVWCSAHHITPGAKVQAGPDWSGSRASRLKSLALNVRCSLWEEQ